MASFNKVVLLGNLTRDPEIKKSPNGVTVAKLRLAVNETYRDRQTGQPKEVACFVDVAVWDKQAESCAQYLTRGSQILVEGRLIYEEWKNAQGESRNRLSVRADRVQFINTVRRPDGAQAPAGQVQGPGSQVQSPGSQVQSAPTVSGGSGSVPVAAPASAPATSAEPPLDDVPF